nr:hypothetical protein [uncultured Desulfobacter sp.]
MSENKHEFKPVSPQLTENTISLFQHTIEQSPQAIFWLNRNGQFEYSTFGD